MWEIIILAAVVLIIGCIVVVREFRQANKAVKQALANLMGFLSPEPDISLDELMEEIERLEEKDLSGIDE